MSVATQLFGPIVNDITGMGDTQELLGGVGRCRWKQLINGMHLNGPWNCVEYVVIPPGASCGKHTHLHTEEIYYILTGAAEMDLNGQQIPFVAGDLVTAPIGTAHGTVNESDENMEFMVVEVFPGAGSSPRPVSLHVPGLPVTAGASRGISAVHRRIDLSALFTGPWRDFTTIELPPSGGLELEPVVDGDEVLFVANGTATVKFGNQSVDGGRGLCVGIPAGPPRAIVNRSDAEPLHILSTIVGLE